MFAASPITTAHIYAYITADTNNITFIDATTMNIPGNQEYVVSLPQAAQHSQSQMMDKHMNGCNSTPLSIPNDQPPLISYLSRFHSPYPCPTTAYLCHIASVLFAVPPSALPCSAIHLLPTPTSPGDTSDNATFDVRLRARCGTDQWRAHTPRSAFLVLQCSS